MDTPLGLAVQFLLGSEGNEALNHATPDTDEGDVWDTTTKRSCERCLCAWQAVTWEDVADEGHEGEGERPPLGGQGGVNQDTGKVLLEGPVHALCQAVLCRVRRDRRLPVDAQICELLLQ